ncbi:MAG: TRAP transporter small permease subunit [Desulfobacterales bacterium]
MRLFIRTVTKFTDITGKILMWLPWILMAIIVWEVALRNVFGRPTIWAHELSVMFFGALAILGGAYTLRARGHVSMDLFYNKLSERGRAVLDIITFPLFFAFVFTLLWYGTLFAMRSYASHEASISTWGPPLWPVKFTIPIGAFLLLIQGIAKLFSDILVAVKGERTE